MAENDRVVAEGYGSGRVVACDLRGQRDWSSRTKCSGRQEQGCVRCRGAVKKAIHVAYAQRKPVDEIAYLAVVASVGLRIRPHANALHGPAAEVVGLRQLQRCRLCGYRGKPVGKDSVVLQSIPLLRGLCLETRVGKQAGVPRRLHLHPGNSGIFYGGQVVIARADVEVPDGTHVEQGIVAILVQVGAVPQAAAIAVTHDVVHDVIVHQRGIAEVGSPARRGTGVVAGKHGGFRRVDIVLDVRRLLGHLRSEIRIFQAHVFAMGCDEVEILELTKVEDHEVAAGERCSGGVRVGHLGDVDPVAVYLDLFD